MAENQIVYQARLHWVLFLWPLILLGGAGYVAYAYEFIRQPALYVGLIAVVWFLVMWANYEFSLLTIKNKQVILKTGILVRKTIDIPMSKIESIDISQSIFGSLLHYGSLVITGTGGTRQMVNYINKPLTCRRYIEQQMHD
ncbi:PH domain-containing protein [Legionella impletisoli]|uniref:Membrane protein n=1 Tax=Legionella impletisoli TaxID=343510 RepID=A0A917NCK2_9GAMM|nr:PH domain-containing protein [Legionella impletisoli]GGI88628.1 membrane protein [Legionella impletisoli]